MNKVELILAARDSDAAIELKRIGEAIGFGNAQSILGRLWDEMLYAEYGIKAGRGQMGVTVKHEIEAEIARLQVSNEHLAAGLAAAEEEVALLRAVPCSKRRYFD
jgi:hypothetical protein